MVKKTPINIKKSLTTNKLYFVISYWDKRMKSFIHKALICTIILIYVAAISHIVFQFTLYQDLPVVDGEAYAVGDIIDLMLVFTVIVLWFASLFLSLIHCFLFFKGNKWFALKMWSLSTLALVVNLYLS